MQEEAREYVKAGWGAGRYGDSMWRRVVQQSWMMKGSEEVLAEGSQVVKAP
jgi:hypothetical protein